MTMTDTNEAQVIAPEAKASGAKTVIVGSTNTPNTGLAIFLALIFGPLGLFYSSVLGGIVMLIIAIPVMLLSFGLGLFLLLPVCAIWAGLASGSKNRKAEAKLKAAMA